jgi:predicted double-glycine peptidase
MQIALLLVVQSLGIIFVAAEESSRANTRPLPQNTIWVPQYKQQTDYSCGPSSSLSVLRYWDLAKWQNVTGV